MSIWHGMAGGAFLTALLLLSPPEPGRAQDAVIGRTIGEPHVVFDSSQGACDGNDYPDAPARAFRDADGQTTLLATHHVNRRMFGPNLRTVRHQCDVVFQGGRHSQPERFDDYGWLAAAFTTDGRTIYALIHNEFHGNQRADLCPSRVYLRCWANAITFAVSHDSGRRFQRLPGNSAEVAVPPMRYQGDQGTPLGYFNPTNIIAWNGYYFAMFSMSLGSRADNGVCLIRTRTLADPGSWRGWDGESFSVPFANPYRLENPEAALAARCKPLAKDRLFYSLGSISQLTERNLFILTMRKQRWDRVPMGDLPGVYISTSSDLLSWSPPQLLLADRDATENGISQLYPALLDPEAGDRNYQQVTRYPLLYTVEIDVPRRNSARRLMARQVEFMPAPAPP